MAQKMILVLGFALVLTLLQVGVYFAVPLNRANVTSLNNLEQSVIKLQNFFRMERATNQLEFAAQQHLPWHPASLTHPRMQAVTDSDCKAVTMTDRNSGLVYQYKPLGLYPVEIEEYNSTNTDQQWYVIESAFPEYYFIGVDDQLTEVITAGDAAKQPLTVRSINEDFILNQLWIFRQPDSTTDNPNFIVMSAKTGLDMNVHNANTTPGTYVQIFVRQNNYNEQVYFNLVLD